MTSRMRRTMVSIAEVCESGRPGPLAPAPLSLPSAWALTCAHDLRFASLQTTMTMTMTMMTMMMTTTMTTRMMRMTRKMRARRVQRSVSNSAASPCGGL